MLRTAARRNHWSDATYAKAFWSQQELRPYRQLLEHTLDWCNPASGEQWLDVGCGGGAVAEGLWTRSNGSLGAVVGVDCAAVHDRAWRALRTVLIPPPGDKLAFVCHDFSRGLTPFGDGRFDHAVAGLSVAYAESFDEATGRWTDTAYDHLLAEVLRVLRPGGRFVFSTNVPEPQWWRIGLISLGDVFRARHPLRFLKRGFRMLRHARWLRREARAGRFHYLPSSTIAAKLRDTGFERIELRSSYARQAVVFRAVKPPA